jgi:integrase
MAGFAIEARLKCAYSVPMKRASHASGDPLSPRSIPRTAAGGSVPTEVPTLRPPLTDRAVRNLQSKTGPIDIRDGSSRLVLTVLPSGRKQFSIRYRFSGKQRRLMFGEYPAVSLAEARKRARQAFAAIDNGRDPAGEQQAAKARPTDTVAVLVKEYVEKHVRVKQRGWKEEQRVLNVNVLPFWKDRSVRELTRRDVRALVAPIVDRGSPIMANRVLAVVRRMLNYGIRNDWLDANPASLIDKPGQEVSRERVLNDDEIRRVWQLLSRQPATAERAAPGRKRSKGTSQDPICPVAPALADAIKLRMLTAQRGGEVITMRWRDIDLETGWWTIPGEFAKNGHAHRVPLVAEALAIIKAQLNDDDRKSEQREDSTGARNDFVFVGTGASIRDRAKKAPSRIARALKIDFRGHDLRRTAATKMAEAGVPRHHISAVLNHVEGGAAVTRIYDRYSYDAEKRRALETWARKLRSIIEQPDPRRMLPFGSGTR